jgi:hypothetical protein
MCIRSKTAERLGDTRTEMFNLPVQQHPTTKPTKQIIPITVIILNVFFKFYDNFLLKAA